MSFNIEQGEIVRSVETLVGNCFGLASECGWWTDLESGEPTNAYYARDRGYVQTKVNIPEKLMLIVSEISEAMEGHRKNLQDDKIPHRKMLEVELADALIRICDLAGGLDLDLPGAVAEKLAFNASREDHKLENRKGEHGKKF